MRHVVTSPRVVGCLLSLFAFCTGIAGADETSSSFDFRDGDRVVLLGGTLIERAQQFGYWETLLTVASADRGVTFRNLGWSGDTVWGESRGLFEPHLGYQRLLEQVQAVNPTVVIVAYGNNEAFAGDEGLDRFVTQYRKLLDDLQSSGRRFVLLSPLLMEAARLPRDPDAPDDYVSKYNRNVDRYADAIGSLAEEGGHRFVDLRPRQREYLSADSRPLTSNGLHLTDAGYQQTARWLAEDLAPSLDSEGFDFGSVSAAKLRDAIDRKNQLFFHRWRPQNFTYLFGFRKHEQGQNAVEIPQFDPLVETAEQEIAELAHAISSNGD